MISSRAGDLTPYTPGEQPQDRSYIKLNTNENPYPPAPAIESYLHTAISADLRRYPDPRFTALRDAAAKRHGVEPENVFAGNGSDEILSFAFYAFFERSVTIPEYTYSFYPVYCDFYGIECRKVPLTSDLGIDLSGLSSDANRADGFAFANPNSPTGTYIEKNAIAEFLKSIPGDRVVVLDEAYIDFGGESCIDLIQSFPNLLVVHTFSKFASLAGLRLGLAYSSKPIIETLFAVKDSFNSYPVNTIAQAAGTLALKDGDYSTRVCGKVINTRERVAAELIARGFTVLPSKANFIFAGLPSVSGRTVYEKLKRRGILVRHFADPALEGFVRITIGTDDDMAALIAAIDAIN